MNMTVMLNDCSRHLKANPIKPLCGTSVVKRYNSDYQSTGGGGYE